MILNNKLAIVILNWNGRKMLETYLPSVVANTPPYASLVIADNGSTDDSLAFVEATYPMIRIVRLDKNYGFAEGYNRALAQIDAEYYVLLNDDVEVTPGWADPIMARFEDDKTLAVCQPKLLMHSDKKRFEYAGASGGFIDSFGYPFCRGRLFNTLEEDNGQYDDICEVFWATGAAMFVRKSVWREVGGFDGDFFAHMEEIDFCWRVRNRGYKIECCPQSVVYHLGGGTLPKGSSRKTYLNFRNNLSMLYKNLPQRRLRCVLTARFLLDYVAAFKFLFGGSMGDFRAVGRAHRHFLKNLSTLKAKRRQLEQNEVNCIYHGGLLIKYYILKQKHYSQLIWKEK